MNKLYVFLMMLATLSLTSPAFAGGASPVVSPENQEGTELVEKAKPTKKEIKAQKKALRKEIRKAILKKKKDNKKNKKAVDPLLRKALVWLVIAIGLSLAGTILGVIFSLAGAIGGLIATLLWIASAVAGVISIYYFVKWVLEEA